MEMPSTNYQLSNINYQVPPRVAFLNSLYYSLKYASGDKVDMYTLFQISKMPLILAQKLILNAFHNKMTYNYNESNNNQGNIKSDIEIDFLCLSNEEFMNGFNIIYFGNHLEKTKLIANLCSFSKNQIQMRDVKLLLNHCHMRFLHDDINEINLKRIIYNFFEEKDNYTINEFISKSLEKNFDIIEIFNTFFHKFKFFNKDQIKLYEHTYLNHLKLWRKTKMNSLNLFEQSINNTSISTNAFGSSSKSESPERKLYKINISKEAEEYINLIKKSFIEYEPFEAEDNEMRRDMEEFDRDLYTTMTSLQRNLIRINVNDLNDDNDYELSNRSNKSLSPFQKYSKKMNKNNLQFAKICKTFFNQNTIDTFDKSEITDSKNITLVKYPKVKTQIKGLPSSRTIDIENTKYIEIFCLKLSKTLTKFKKVKLILADNLIFYYIYNQRYKNDSNSYPEYKLKLIIYTSQLFPSVIDNPLMPNNLSKIINKNTMIYQYQIFSTLHNNQIIYNFFLTNKEDIETLNNHINKVEKVRNIFDTYDLNSKETIQIGSGHFGNVLLCTHKITQKQLAIKIIFKNHNERDKMKNNHKSDNPDEELEEVRKIENFKCIQWEKDIFMFLSNLRNAPNIVKCYEWFETAKCIYYVNEYCNGGNIKKLNITNNFSIVNLLTKHLISGLYTLHSYGIIHRDIKNTNTLIVKRDDGKFILKIIDFGLSKVMGSNELAYEGYGSLPYKTPEQLLGKKYNFSVDIWALGITVYWLIYNNFPVCCQSKHKMKKLLVKYEYNNKDKSNDNNLCFKVLRGALVNDYKKRLNIKDLMKIKDNNEE